MNTKCTSNFDCTNNAECLNDECWCSKGFVAKGTACVDVNECQTEQCGPFAICVNNVGSFRCECENGYTGSPPRVQCKAPCEDVTCGNHAYCKPDGQEAYCICEDGWTFDPSDISAGCIGKVLFLNLFRINFDASITLQISMNVTSQQTDRVIDAAPMLSAKICLAVLGATAQKVIREIRTKIVGTLMNVQSRLLVELIQFVSTFLDLTHVCVLLDGWLVLIPTERCDVMK